MALTKGTLFCINALKRESKLKEPRDISHISYKAIKTQEHVQRALSEYAAAGSLKKSDIDECISLLEHAESLGACKNIATFIANEIIPHSLFEGVDLSNISTSNRIIIESSMETVRMYDRLLENQSILEKRFNITSLCRERQVKDICNVLCESIDTYNTPVPVKFLIALENVLFSLVKNNVPVKSDAEVADYVVEYFVSRDAIIPDNTYKAYKQILKDNDIYDLSESSLYVSTLLKDDKGNYFGDKVTKIFSEANDDRLREFAEKFDVIHSEADALVYINEAKDFIDHNQVTTLDKNRIYYSIGNITNHSGIDHSFIKMAVNSVFGNDIDDLYAINVDFEDKSQDVFATIPSIDNVLAEVECSQCKDYLTLEKLRNNIFSKPISSIYGKTYEIIQCIRETLCLIISKPNVMDSEVQNSCDVCMKFISDLYNQSVNFAAVAELNRNIKTYLLNLPDGIGNKNHYAVKDFQRKLERLLEMNSDTSINEEADIFACFNNEEDAMEAFCKLAEATDYVMHHPIDRTALEYVVDVCAENGWVKPLYEAFTYLNAPAGIFESAYEKCYNEKTMVCMEDIVSSINEPYVQGSLKSLFLMIEATNLFESLDESFTELEESNKIDISKVKNNAKKTLKNNLNSKEIKKKGANFITSLKLGLQVLKKNAKRFDAKQQEMWRTLDAYGNKFSKVFDEDDDKRRAQLLQGQCIPSFSKCIKSGVGLIIAGVATGNIMIPMITAFGMLGTNKFLNNRQLDMMIDEIQIELNVVGKELDIAEKDDDLRTYRQLLVVQKKLQHEMHRLRRKKHKLL